MIVNTGGGMAGGDSYRRRASTLGEGAEVEATTPSAEKIYRSDGPAAAHRDAARRSTPGARLFWLPQETLLFEGARLERRLEVETSGDAALVDRRNAGVRPPRDGRKPIDAQLQRLAGAFAATAGSSSPTRRGSTDAGAALDRPAVGAGARALATIVAAAPNIEARLPDLRAALEAAEPASVEAARAPSTALIVARLFRRVASTDCARRCRVHCRARRARAAAVALMTARNLQARRERHEETGPMNLTPREKDKLLIAMAAMVARRRLERGVKLNHPEAVALITDFVVEGARDGRSVAELMEAGAHVVCRRSGDGRRSRR